MKTKAEKAIENFDSRMLSIEEASNLLGVSQQTLRNWEEAGRLPVERTSGGHRRYSEKQINEIRKTRMRDAEIIIPGVFVSKMTETIKSFLSGFEANTKINISISTSQLDQTVTFAIESEDGLEGRSKAFKMAD